MNIHSYQFISSLDLVIKRKFFLLHLLNRKRFLFLTFLLPSQLLQLWEKNGYFDEETIQQLQNPALGLGQYQVTGTCLNNQILELDPNISLSGFLLCKYWALWCCSGYHCCFTVRRSLPQTVDLSSL